MFPAGRLDRPVVIQSLTETVSPGGAAVQVWTDFASVWAAKQEVTARERFRASQEIGEEVAVFTIRWRDDITSSMRLQHDGKIYQLAPPVEIGRREGLELTGTAVRA